MIETERLKIYASFRAQMEDFIAAQTEDALKAAYTQMLDGCLAHPDQWDWYAIWMIESKSGAHIGEMCFKGVVEDGTTEIGYGIAEEYRGRGYASEAVTALTDWALRQPCVRRVTAETDADNIASQKVLCKTGFVPTGRTDDARSLYVRKKNGKDKEN